MLLTSLGVLLVTAGLSYALWSVVRVVRLRQDLYDERDSLFDRAVELDSLNDPAYRATREYLNALCANAENLSIRLFAYCTVASSQWSDTIPKAQNPQMEQAIDLVIRHVATRIFRYLLFETVSGWAFFPIMCVISVRAYTSRVTRILERWIRSGTTLNLVPQRA